MENKKAKITIEFEGQKQEFEADFVYGIANDDNGQGVSGDSFGMGHISAGGLLMAYSILTKDVFRTLVLGHELDEREAFGGIQEACMEGMKDALHAMMEENPERIKEMAERAIASMMERAAEKRNNVQ